MMRSSAGSTASSAPPDGSPAARFAQAVARLDPSGGTVGLAVSGGPDSMAMLALAHRTMPGRFMVASVDHGLRPEAAAECALVAEACASRSIPCEVLACHPAPGNVQGEARRARYAVLGAWGLRHALAAIATAHHADDQAETLLMRLNRGCGVAGLAGVRARVASVVGPPVIRPLLGFRRAQLAAIVAEEGLPFVADPSNADERFERVRMRHALAEAPWLDQAAIAAAAAHLAEADHALDHYAEAHWRAHAMQGEGWIRLDPADAPAAVLLRLAERAVRSLGSPPRGSDVARLVALLQAGQGGNVGKVLAKADSAGWLFRPERRRAPR